MSWITHETVSIQREEKRKTMILGNFFSFLINKASGKSEIGFNNNLNKYFWISLNTLKVILQFC